MTHQIIPMASFERAFDEPPGPRGGPGLLGPWTTEPRRRGTILPRRIRAIFRF